MTAFGRKVTEVLVALACISLSACLTTKHVYITNEEIYEYNFGKLGDEQGPEIRKQANHFEISELVWPNDSIEPTYRYKPQEGFIGRDSVVIYLLEENLEREDAEPYVLERFRFNINVSE